MTWGHPCPAVFTASWNQCKDFLTQKTLRGREEPKGPRENGPLCSRSACPRLRARVLTRQAVPQPREGGFRSPLSYPHVPAFCFPPLCASHLTGCCLSMLTPLTQNRGGVYGDRRAEPSWLLWDHRVKDLWLPGPTYLPLLSLPLPFLFLLISIRLLQAE